MLEWISENLWSFWLIMFLLLISVQVVTGEMIFLLIALGTLAAVLADILGAIFYVQLTIVTVISLAGLILLRRFDTSRAINDSGPSPWSVKRYIGSTGEVTGEVTSQEGFVKIGNEIWSARTHDSHPIPAAAIVTVEAIEGAIAWVSTKDESTHAK